MPSMFSRRRGSSAQPPASRSTMNAAAAAATQAYANQAAQRTPSLSSAAAAAALRSHTTTPEPVGSLQTKRMMRRGSISSVTSGNGAINSQNGRPGLQRSNSSGSMTERTFRTKSPSPSRANGTRSPAITAPPVPPLPKTLRNGSSRRANSIDPPERIMSPTPVNNRRSISVDQTNLKAQAATTSAQPQVSDIDMQKRPPSVNFSRPRVGSPEPSPVTSPNSRSGKSGWFAGPSGSTTKQSTAAPEMEYVMVFDANSRTFVRQARPKKAASPEPASPVIDATPQLKPGDYDPATRSIVPLPKAQQSKKAEPSSQRPATLLHKQPSIVREDPDAEREAEAASPTKVARPLTSTQDTSVPPRSYASAGGHHRSASLDVPRGGSDSRGRDGSLSPSRSARFSVTPIMDSTLHEPHRGVSPAKSALKHSPSSSIRTASPVATFSPAVVAQSAPSDVSDTTSLTSADGSSGKKRRSVRVSFDDEAPVPPLPAAMTAVRPSAARTTEIVSDDDQDEIMKPRPELPNFGSIRRNKQQPDVAEKVTETSPERTTTTPEDTVKPVDAPIPPQVTTRAPAPVIEEAKDEVPAINLHPPTPAIEEDKNLTDDEVGRMSESQEIQKLASGLIFYGDESDDSRSRRLSGDLPAPTRKDSDADQYTDAPETQDTSQAGFASLDAIVESPLASPVKDKGDTSPPADWTAASAHWSKLSKQQKENHENGGVAYEDDTKSKRSFFKRNKKPKDVPTPASTVLVPTVVDTAPDSPPASPITKSVPSAVAQPLKPALKKTAPKEETHHMLRSMRDSELPVKKQRPISAQVAEAPKSTKATRPVSTQVDSYSSTKSKQPREPAPIQASSHTVSKMSKKLQDDSDSESSFKKKRRAASTVGSQGRYSMKRSMRAGSIDSTQRVASPTPSGRTRGSSFLRSSSPTSVMSGRESLRSTLRSGQPANRTMRSAPESRAPPTSMTSRFKSRFVDSDEEDERPAQRQYRSRFVDSDDEDGTIPEELTPVRGIPRRKGQEDGDSTDLEDESDRERSPRKKSIKTIAPTEAEIEKAMDAARRKLGLSTPASAQPQEGAALQQGTLRDRDNDKVLLPPDVMSETGSNADPQAKKKKGFMGGLLKRSKNTSSTAQVESPLASPKLTPASPQGKAQTDGPSSPTAKLARRASNQPPKLQRGNSGFSTATAPAAHGRSENEHWPLPPPVPTDRISVFKNRDTERPQTSDEALESTRPSERPQNRRSFSARVGFTDDAVARDESQVSDVYSKRTGRKKRFGLLRKAFGLYD